jgi:hypothetical protein
VDFSDLLSGSLSCSPASLPTTCLCFTPAARAIYRIRNVEKLASDHSA